MRLKSIIALIAFSALTFFSPAQAQTLTDSEASTFCDELLPMKYRALQDEANAECKTIDICLECVDRKSGFKLYATLVVQPNDPKCKPLEKIATEPDALHRGGTPSKPAHFKVEIIQSPCINGGNNLQAFIPGWGTDSREFSFLWEVDGVKGGHLPSLFCACGKQAKLRVAHNSSGESVVVAIKLHPCNDSKK